MDEKVLLILFSGVDKYILKKHYFAQNHFIFL